MQALYTSNVPTLLFVLKYLYLKKLRYKRRNFHDKLIDINAYKKD